MMKTDFSGLLDFESLIESLRNNENEEKREVVSRHESIFGPIPNNICDWAVYKDYLRFFKPVKYAVSKQLEDDFDFELLLQLVTASFSSSYCFVNRGQFVDLSITCVYGDTIATRVISELCVFQIFRLFEIYIGEQLQFASAIYSGVKIISNKENDSSDSLFISDTENQGQETAVCITDDFPSFDEYLKMCSYMVLSENGESLIRDRYLKIKEYRDKALMVDDTNDIFLSNNCPF